ncbi:hypothetical protein BSKO_13852 [Bryopsis sp. KO-2023]|nr:hypothetical protein BSKO_13852 [Bryopsis sp. KO-2023]
MCAFTSMNSGLGRQLRSGAATHRPGSRASVGFGKRNALGTPAPQRRRFSGRVLRPNGRFVSTVGDLAGVRTPASSGVADLLDAQEVQDSKQEK